MGKTAKAKREQKKAAAANRNAVNAAKSALIAKYTADEDAAAPAAATSSSTHRLPSDVTNGDVPATVQQEVVYVEEPGLGIAGAQFDSLVNDRFVAPVAAAEAALVAKEADQELAAVPVDNVGEEGLVDVKKPTKKERMALGDLKLKAPRPDLVEYHDCNSPEPLAVVLLKAERNTLPVPRHWAQKSLFLATQINREITDEVVPAFIENTGVAAMRSDKAGLDVMALAKPFTAGHAHLPLTQFGDIFFEGKDLRSRFRRFKPGMLSDRMRQALGMAPNTPPPFLYGMQVVRKLPPAYPGIKIPGMNAPLPSGARWGKSRGEWGQPVRNPDNSLKWPEVMNVSAQAEESDLKGSTELAFGDYSQANSTFAGTSFELWGSSATSGGGGGGVPTVAFTVDEAAEKQRRDTQANAAQKAKEEAERNAEAQRAAVEAAARAAIPGFAPSAAALGAGYGASSAAMYQQRDFGVEMQQVQAQGYGSGMLATQGAYVQPGFENVAPGQGVPSQPPIPGTFPPQQPQYQYGGANYSRY